MTRRKICVVTGSRAEYGLLYWLMKEIKEDPELILQIAVTGMHLSPEFGLTYQIIEQDGFEIDAKVEMLVSSDTPVGIAKSMGLGIIGFADAFSNLSPDIVVLLGDRYEIFAAAQAAMVARIPIAHIHGGETTEGAIDEAIRHSITKMAHLHFVAALPYRNRVIQLGEQPDRVYNFGAPGLDHIRRTKLLSKEVLEKQLDFTFGTTNFLVTYHPTTLQTNTADGVGNLLAALEHFPDVHIIFTKSNADTDGHMINQRLQAYANRHPQRMKVFASLGQLRYLSCLQYVDVVIGNSSSGIIEVPLFNKPTVNIGNRQKGRLKGETIIDCGENINDIVAAIEKALSPAFQQIVSKAVPVFGYGNASQRIKDVLKQINLENIIIKSFYDIEF